MKLTAQDFILLEVFKEMYEPGKVISWQHLAMRSIKVAGIRVGLGAVQKFMKEMQEQGYGKYALIETKNPRFKDRNYGFICK